LEQIMNELSRLTPPPGGGVKEKKRVGRGQASGQGKTAGRGGKGQKARTGNMNFIGFEGGQMPLQRRIPKRGFTNFFRVEYALVNVGQLDKLEGTSFGPEELLAANLFKAEKDGVKILGDGEITRAVTVRVHKISASAREKIEKAGGKIELIEVVKAPTPQQRKAVERAEKKAAAKKPAKV
jgi:large subunit ribosomal protein L15